MIHNAVKLVKSGTLIGRPGRARFHPWLISTSLEPKSGSSRFLHEGSAGPDVSTVATQMVNYALSHARSQKSEESYAQGMIVLEQCLSNQSTGDRVGQDSMGMVLLAMSNLSYERGKYGEATEHLKRILSLSQSSWAVRAVAAEALVGIYLLSGNDGSSSAYVDKCLESLGSHEGDGETILAFDKALKGLVELIKGNKESAESFFHGFEGLEGCGGNAALSYAEFAHATGDFPLAKELYEKVVQNLAETNDSAGIISKGACNMTSDEILLAATFCSGQLQSHMGNFCEAEETLTRALTKAEELFGYHHLKVGAVLTGIAVMFRNKARHERTSAFLVQEGLYRRALELLKPPPLETEAGTEAVLLDVMALARGGYAELLLVQENRKSEGEKMKSWAETVWRNRRISLKEALNYSEPSKKVPVIDMRTGRVL